ncbi:MAG TPA: antibiotic biosynthesis monooxygenase [Acidimicrobiales bacterium]|nr:antibiotic biosynthesis monooxygenase [Acidimicrobiales bacterium]
MAVMEIDTFQLAEGVEEADFLDADRRMQADFAHQQPGILRRTTARTTDGEKWVVVVLWASEADADAAATMLHSDPVAGAFMALVDPASLERTRVTTLG